MIKKHSVRKTHPTKRMTDISPANVLSHIVKKLLFCIAALVLFAAMGISCGKGDGGSDPIEEEDPFELWKVQPNQKIVFMSKADSTEGELYLLDKSGQTTGIIAGTTVSKISK